MTIDEALRIVEALAAGCDPRTGEALVRPQIVVRPDASEALVTVAEALQVVRSVCRPETTHDDPNQEPQGGSLIPSTGQRAPSSVSERAVGPLASRDLAGSTSGKPSRHVPSAKQHWGGWLAHLRDPDGNVLTLVGYESE